MRISFLIFVSLVVNFALAALLFRPGPRPEANAGEAQMESSSVAAADNSPSTGDDRLATTPAGAKISWRDLQAAELKEFVARLRAVNCPEETIKDLVLADLNRRYAKQQQSIFSDRQNQDYWKPYQRKVDPVEQKTRRERMKQIQALMKEKKALLVELFGVDVEKQRRKEEGYDTENMGWNPSGNLAFLPEAKREAVQKYLEDFSEKEQEFYASIQGGYGPEDRAKQKKLEQEKLAGLAQFLTPPELREYELRYSPITQQIGTSLHGLDIDRAQFEAMFDIYKKYGDSVYNYGDADNTPEQVKQIQQNLKDMQAALAATFSPEKSAEFTRAQDYQYQQLASLAKRNDLPPETAPKIYDFKQAAEKAAAAVKASPDFSPEERQAALAQIRAETEAAVKTALGDKLYKRYQGSGGWWLNNLAPSTAQRVNSVIVR